MNKSKNRLLHEFSSVFTFTLAQNFKSKGIKIITFILVGIALASMPVLHFIDSSGSSKEEKFPASTVYVLDETGLDVGNFSAMVQKYERYSNTTFQEVKETKALASDEMQITISNSQGGFLLSFISNPEGISEAKVNEVTPEFIEFFNKKRQAKLGVTEAQNKILEAAVESKVTFLDSVGQVIDEEESISMEQYYTFLGIIVLMIFLIAFSAETVSTSIVTEKSSKLVENLLLCIRPSMLILGKVAGALCTVFVQVGAMIAALAASAFLAKSIFNLNQVVLPGQMQELLAQIGDLSPARIIIAALIAFLGVVFFGFLAGLFGAAVSRIEDMAEGLKVYNILLILGAYSGIGLSIAKVSGGGFIMLERVLSFVPISAPFVVPMELLMGEIGIPFAILVCIVMIGFTILLALFVARVYQTMLLHKGDKIKLKTMIRLGRGGNA